MKTLIDENMSQIPSIEIKKTTKIKKKKQRTKKLL